MCYDYASFVDMVSRHDAVNWSDSVMRQCLALAGSPPDSNTEPLPAPAIDREHEAWKVAARSIAKAGSRISVFQEVVSDETDTLLRTLAPHWRELRRLSGERDEVQSPSNLLLRAWWNIYHLPDGSMQLNRHSSPEAARENAMPACTHVAVRLTVVEDAI